jgi:hypothetical protein
VAPRAFVINANLNASSLSPAPLIKLPNTNRSVDIMKTSQNLAVSYLISTRSQWRLLLLMIPLLSAGCSEDLSKQKALQVIQSSEYPKESKILLWHEQEFDISADKKAIENRRELAEQLQSTGLFDIDEKQFDYRLFSIIRPNEKAEPYIEWTKMNTSDDVFANEDLMRNMENGEEYFNIIKNNKYSSIAVAKQTVNQVKKLTLREDGLNAVVEYTINYEYYPHGRYILQYNVREEREENRKYGLNTKVVEGGFNANQSIDLVKINDEWVVKQR